MELLETEQSYQVFTKNDRSVGSITYSKNDLSEDIVFQPYFRKAGDPWIGALDGSIDKDDWKTSRELFGRYLDDPDFRIGFPEVRFVIRPDVKIPAWMGDELLVLVEFDNKGQMICRYGTEKVRVFYVSTFDYEGEINIEETSKFARDEIKKEAPRIGMMLNMMPPPNLLSIDPDEDDDTGF